MKKTIRTIEISWEEATRVRFERRVVKTASPPPSHNNEKDVSEQPELVDAEDRSEMEVL